MSSLSPKSKNKFCITVTMPAITTLDIFLKMVMPGIATKWNIMLSF